MKTFASWILLAVCLAWGTAWAGTQTGQVTVVLVRASDGLVHFYMTGQASDKPPCAIFPYWMIKAENTTTGKQQLAQLLVARTTGQTITIYGSNTCTRWGDGEDVDTIAY